LQFLIECPTIWRKL